MNLTLFAEPEVSYAPTLPGMGDVVADRAAAVGAAAADALTLDLARPLPSISSTTRQLETFSPLFRESSANLQQSLF